MTEFVAEFFGTALLILLGNGVVANVVLTGTKGNNSGWIVITTAWALAVFVGVVIAAPFSGAHLNPAVTIALAIAQKFHWVKVPYYILAQLCGAMVGSFLVWVMYKDHFDATDDKGLKAAPFATAPAIRNLKSNLFSEILGTFVLIFVIFYFTNAEMGSDKTPIGLGSLGAIPVAFLVWVIGLALGGTTGYAINPVRDLGPRIIHAIIPMKGKGSSDWGYSWVPIVGPIIGATLAALLYLSLNL
ncbi:MAG: aquaporin family protein [Chryseobacterium sp.]|uniref:Aquaporin family protein n=1 Tax=Pedobacter agri TaxID=454586 RepID=A0A9X3DFR2_9SPHI|nr:MULTISPECIES: MIP/aquaporin family protein [Pedobacter]AZI27053.1 aquaporin family protein [Pedobacter sp. G11]MCX3265290.1 aquaporin family protein [Pedobacter agri]MDQ1138749.1 glycerol uptake facilitator protein [Pedobacter agri]RZJ88902.1 MAG: aquaporin family protein [Chryseobacterium sp.]